MKLGKVAQLCKGAQNITIVHTDGGEKACMQWVGTRYALYPFYNLPKMDEKTAFVVFDVDEKKRHDYSYHEIAAKDSPLCLDERDATEISIQPEQYSLCFQGGIYVPFVTSKGIRLISRAYLAPMMSKLDEMMFYERKTTGGFVYIVAKLGLLLAGVIVPEDVRSDDQSLLAFTRNLVDGVEFALECAEKDEQQSGEPEIVLVDRSTGEVVDDATEEEPEEDAETSNEEFIQFGSKRTARPNLRDVA